LEVLVGVFQRLDGANSSLDEQLPQNIKDCPDSSMLIFRSEAKNLELILLKALALQLVAAGILFLSEVGNDMDEKACVLLNKDSVRGHCCDKPDQALRGTPLRV
jgi:hypothetical protein